MPERADLEVDEDRVFQERFWTVQRFAWSVMGLFIVAALAGATGSGGPLADAKVAGPSGMIEYPRVARWQAAERMIVRLPASASGKARLELSDAFTHAFTIEDIEPQPSASVATASGHSFVFDLGPAGRDKSIIFHLRASSPSWPERVRARIGNGPPLPLSFVVLP